MAEFYFDHNVRFELATLLVALGHRVTRTRDLHFERATDDEQLLTAAQRRWILVTYDTNDYELLHDAWQRWATVWGVQQRHSGILLLPQLSMPVDQAAAIVGLLAAGPALVNELYRWRAASGWRCRG